VQWGVSAIEEDSCCIFAEEDCLRESWAARSYVGKVALDSVLHRCQNLPRNPADCITLCKLRIYRRYANLGESRAAA
jgi:hypothetical protein